MSNLIIFKNNLRKKKEVIKMKNKNVEKKYEVNLFKKEIW